MEPCQYFTTTAPQGIAEQDKIHRSKAWTILLKRNARYPILALTNRWMCKHLDASPYIIAASERDTSASILKFPVEIKVVGSYLYDPIGVLRAAGKKNMTGGSSNNTRKSPHSMTRVSRACQRCRRQKLKVGLYCLNGLCGCDGPAPILTRLALAVR